MATVNTNDLRVKNAKNFISSLGSDGGYVFVGRQMPWDTGDNSPPPPQNNTEGFNQAYDQMISLNRIDTTEVYHMIPRINWSSGVVYDMYRHDYTINNRANSGASNLYNASFVVMNQNYDVYACLDNDGRTQSTTEPLNTGNEPFYTSDGYQWLWLYGMSSNQVFDYGTTNYIPIVTGNNVITTDGAVFTAVIDVPGNNYTGNPSGITNQLQYYYCNINGDGTGAVARIQVSGGSVVELRVVRNGSGYTYGKVDFTANNCYQSLGDLDLNANALNPLGDGTFSATLIIQPPGGFGTDLPRELGGTRVGLFSSLMYDSYYYIQDVSFRQVGVVQDATFTTVNPVEADASYAVNVTDFGGIENYAVGEEIIQEQDHDGVTKKAKGVVVGWDLTNHVIRYIQDPRYHSDDDGVLYRFTGTDYIIGQSTDKVTEPTELTGTLTGLSFIDGYSQPEINKYTGYFSYLSNIQPVQRETTQSEKVTLILNY